MLRSLFTGISGLKAHQTMMDVVGNNIANVNTAGFKSSQTVFEDTLSEMVRASGAPQGMTGGVNPAQVGLGVRLAGVLTNFAQGATQSTGRATDMMIQGDGFFVVNQGGENLYTRSGSFSFDRDGHLVTNSGAFVQGWTADASGTVSAAGSVGPITLSSGMVQAPKSTATAGMGGNLPPGTAAGDAIVKKDTWFDTNGNPHDVQYTYTRQASTTAGQDDWKLDVAIDGAATPSASTTVSFDAATGALKAPGSGTLTVPLAGTAVSLDLSKLKGYGGENTLTVDSQDGHAMGTLQAFSISSDGTLLGSFSNGVKEPLARIAIANFNNPGGLEKAGGTAFRASVNSGNPDVGGPGSAGRGVLVNNALEMSNVDLANEFTGLIVAQRGFQANTKVITTSDEILDQLVNLKR
jgi:flagellar hook protein FlgE